MTAKIIPFPKPKMTQKQRNVLIREAIDNLLAAQEILADLAKKHDERMKREKGNE